MTFLDYLIPPFLKKLDRFLLVRYPNLWVTNLHFVVFYTLILDLILVGLASIGSHSLKGDAPDSELAAGLMVLPAVIIFVFWFIKQARYNVDKNYGRSHLGNDLLNFVAYMICCLCFASVVIVVPSTTEARYGSIVTPEELKQDADVLNTGFCYFQGYNHYGNYNVERAGNNIRVTRDLYIYLYDYESDYYSYSETEEVYEQEEIITEEQALREVSNFLHTYEKYLGKPTNINPRDALNMALRGESWPLTESYSYDYYTEPEYKINRIHRIQKGHGFTINNEEMLKVLFGIFGFLSLLVWMFKQVHWQNYLALVITAAVLPLILGLIYVLIYEVFGLRGHADELFVVISIAIIQLLTSTYVIVTWIGKTYSPLGVVLALINQLWLPFCASFYVVMYVDITWDYDSEMYRWEYYNDIISATYWVGWIAVIGSILLLKPYYKRMLNMPRKK